MGYHQTTAAYPKSSQLLRRPYLRHRQLWGDQSHSHDGLLNQTQLTGPFAQLLDFGGKMRSTPLP